MFLGFRIKLISHLTDMIFVPAFFATHPDPPARAGDRKFSCTFFTLHTRPLSEQLFPGKD
jgi:hypothetical protein